MIHLSLDGEHLVARTDLSTEGTLCSKVPGARYVRRGDYWRLPATRPAVVQLQAICGKQLDCLPANVAELAFPPAPTEPVKVPGLYGYQEHGAGFLAGRGRALLADPCGAGKSAQAAVALKAPALIVCPPTVVGVWQAELATWRPDLLTTVVGSGVSAAKRRKMLTTEESDVIVVSYPIVWRHARLAPFGNTKLTDDDKTEKELDQPWATVLFDECHHLIHVSKQTLACWNLADRSERVYALSGTPLSEPENLWFLLRLIDGKAWSVRSKHENRYLHQRYNAWGQVVESVFAPETRPELEALTAPIILRRSKADILPDLPAKRFAVREVEMPAKQAKQYASLRKTMLAELENGQLLVCPDPMQKVLRLLQAASATMLSLEDGVPQLGLPSSKAEAVLELLSERGAEATVCMSASRKVSRLIGNEVARCTDLEVLFLDGQVPPEARQQVLDRFQEGGAWLFGTYAVASTGVNLHAADMLIRVQRPWSLTLDSQAVDRIHRVGSTHSSVLYLDIRSAGTLESRVAAALEEKASVLSGVVRDPEVLAEWLEAA